MGQGGSAPHRLLMATPLPPLALKLDYRYLSKPILKTEEHRKKEGLNLDVVKVHLTFYF